MRNALMRAFLTPVTCVLSRQGCPASVMMRTAFSPRFGIEAPLAATSRTPSALPFEGADTTCGRVAPETTVADAPEPSVILSPPSNLKVVCVAAHYVALVLEGAMGCPRLFFGPRHFGMSRSSSIFRWNLVDARRACWSEC